jgi:hypothetical protein
VASLASKSFDSPDETRTPEKTNMEIVRLATSTAARVRFSPGWTWSECIKPVAGTDSCQVHHLGVVVSGRLHVVHNDGSEAEVGPGEAFEAQPGHDAWVVGDEEFVAYEFDAKAAQTYAKGG